jgi:hypothetical protein
LHTVWIRPGIEDSVHALQARGIIVLGNIERGKQDSVVQALRKLRDQAGLDKPDEKTGLRAQSINQFGDDTRPDTVDIDTGAQIDQHLKTIWLLLFCGEVQRKGPDGFALIVGTDKNGARGCAVRYRGAHHHLGSPPAYPFHSVVHSLGCSK